jgi:hypothetical protein
MVCLGSSPIPQPFYKMAFKTIKLAIRTEEELKSNKFQVVDALKGTS